MVTRPRMGWVRRMTCTVNMRDAQSVLVGNPKGKKTLGRPRRKWDDNNEMDFTLYLPCIFVQLINSHQQMHQNKFVTDLISDKLVLVHLLV
jgi:hypothetical protein